MCHPSSQDKVVEDKTFGLKNKSKSKKVQQYVPSLVAAMVPSLRLAACLQCFLFVCLPAIDPGLAHRSKPPHPHPSPRYVQQVQRNVKGTAMAAAEKAKADKKSQKQRKMEVR